MDGDGPSPAALGELGATRVTFGPGLLRLALRSLCGSGAPAGALGVPPAEGWGRNCATSHDGAAAG
ncbi:MAG: hypothetical protein JF597_38365 [Streptomyces sp.]|uniref:hypothetical protein n=1 Tax=Streptomyces sp. TaxID=1931 RepID=UPI0025ECA221|nr:hypothetical protein [Streptomyces sp.]MBW8799225.1 hypothetical protein [Streptomyces sp.]